MAVSVVSKSSLLMTGAEQNLLSTEETTPGIYTLVVDASPMAGADVLVLRLKEMVKAGGTTRTRKKLTTAAGAQDPAVLELGPIEIATSFQASLHQTAVTVLRTLDWELRRIG